MQKTNKYLMLSILMWMVIVLFMWLANWRTERHAVIQSAHLTADGAIVRDLLFRRWNATHRGVYVPISEHTQANPYLNHDPRQIIVTTSGDSLTLVNPAFMIRQMHKLIEDSLSEFAHITSKHPIRPENAATAWELEALEAFEEGAKNYSKIITLDDEDYYFYMLPLMVEKSCLACHAHQGYEEGSLRGGLSSTIPLKNLYGIRSEHNRSTAFSHAMIFLIGCAGLFYGYTNIRKSMEKRATAEKLLLEKQYYLEKAQEVGEIGTWELDLATNQLFWTDENCRIFGVPEGSLVSYEIFIEKVHPDDRVYVKNQWEKALQGVPYDIEHRLLIGEEVRWVREKAEFVFDEKGHLIKAVGVTQNISQRVSNEKQINEVNASYQSVLKTSLEGFWICDMDGCLLEVNETYAKMSGFERNELLKMQIRDVEALQSESEIDDNLLLLKQEGGGIFESAHRRKDGSQFEVEVSVQYREQGDGQFIVFIRDVSKRKLIEKGLRDSEFLLRESQRVSGIGSYILDIELGTWESSLELDSLYGLQEDSVKDISSWLNLVHPGDREMMQSYFLVDVLQSNESFDKEYRIQRELDGVECWVHGLGKLEYNDDGKPARMIGSIQDISNRKEREAEKALLESQLQRSQKLESLGTMIGGISHEFNNILQGIMLYGGLIENEAPEGGEVHQNVLKVISQAKHARKIVRQILTFSRNRNTEIKSVFLHEIVIEAIEFEMASLPANITLQQEVDLNGPRVYCDRTQIHQIVINLINNAQYAIGDSGGTITVSQRTIAQADKRSKNSSGEVELRISDTGCGIDADLLEKVFDPFYTTKPPGEGTGLGLSVIHGIIEMMKGRVSVESEVGKGTTFRILLPITDEINESSHLNVVKQSNPKGFVLFVDDNVGIREAAEAILTSEGWNAEVSKDGKEALAMFKANIQKFDLIITDQSMPEMTGIALTRKIRTLDRTVPILLSTGELGIDEKREFRGTGITGFIQKPWTADELIARIREIDFD